MKKNIIHKLKVLYKNRDVEINHNLIEGEMIPIDIELNDLIEFGSGIDSLKNLISKRFGAKSKEDVHLDVLNMSGHVVIGNDFVDYIVNPEDIERGADQWLRDIENKVANLTPGVINLIITKID